MEREEKAAGALDDPRDRRSHPRYAVDEDSMLLLVNRGLSLESHILDLSLEGCRLSTRERFDAGTRTRVEVTFKVNGIAFRFVGVIQWTDGKYLVGIRFVEMISRRREQLAEVVCELEAAAAAGAAQEARALTEQHADTEGEEAARKQEQEQARELADKEARQWAEIQEIARRAKCARQAGPVQLPGQESNQPDRRAQERHAVETTATILLVKIGSRLGGRIVDLSLNGCRIRSDERFPVGIYTRVETEFCLEGLRFRLGGVIQAIHDRHNVGIRFLDMSERKREQLEQLVGEIERMRAMRGAGEP